MRGFEGPLQLFGPEIRGDLTIWEQMGASFGRTTRFDSNSLRPAPFFRLDLPKWRNGFAFGSPLTVLSNKTHPYNWLGMGVWCKLVTIAGAAVSI